MKTRLLFAAAALAAAFAGCTQDELVSVNELQSLGDRPMGTAPVITLDDADTRMSATGYATVVWDEGDGFGACLIDEYDGSETTWAAKFAIKDWVSTNILYKKGEGTDTFEADASLAQGNYLFYAPFNKDNYLRQPLTVQLPTEQHVGANEGAAPNNKAVSDYFAAGNTPVFVAYDSISAYPKTSLSLKMYHLQALPRVTLKLGNVQLLDETGALKVSNKQPEYETSIAVDSIIFRNTAEKIKTKGEIKNSAVVSRLTKKYENGVANVTWEKERYETAATSDLVNADKENGTEAVKVVFDEEGGRVVTAAGTDFFMVLPAAKYEAADLAIEVYTNINGEAYVMAENSLDGMLKEAKAAKAVQLVPGLPYSADEYNQDGSMKDSKGTSMTFTIEGGFMPVNKVEASGYTEIATKQELIDYLNNVAYRGEELLNITKKEALAYMQENGGTAPDRKKYFVVTATDEAPIAIDEEVMAAFNNSCVITDGNALMRFKEGCKNVTLGDITYTLGKTPIYWNGGSFSNTDDAWTYSIAKTPGARTIVKGNMTLTGTGRTYNDTDNCWQWLKVETGATLTMDSKMTDTSIYTENAGGTVNVKTTTGTTILNYNGTVNVAANATLRMQNGYDDALKSGSTPTAVTNIADGVTAQLSAGGRKDMTYGNCQYGKITVGSMAKLTVNKNVGLIVMDASDATLTVTNGTGNVDNTEGGKVTADGDTVYATLEAMTDATALSKYDEVTNLTQLNLTGKWTISTQAGADAFSELLSEKGPLAGVKTLNFKSGSSLSLSAGPIKLDLSSLEKIGINADVTWTGRSATASSVKLNTAGVVVKGQKNATTAYKLTVTDIKVVNKDDEEITVGD